MPDRNRRAHIATARAGLIAAILAAIAAWAAFEPASPPDVGGKADCQYTYDGARPKSPKSPPTGFKCSETPGQSHQDDAYEAARYSDPLSVLAAARHYLHKLVLDPVSLLTLVLALSTVALWWATRQLWRSAERALMTTERAFVFLKGYTPAAWGENEKGELVWFITPVLENSGSTPTRHMLCHVSVKVFNGPVPEDFDFPDFWDPEIKPGNRPGFIGPKAITMMARVSVRLDDLQQVQNGSRKALLYGWAEYDDVFDGPRHRFEFCSEIMVAGPLTELTSVLPVFYHRHNGSDDECMKAPTPWQPD